MDTAASGPPAGHMRQRSDIGGDVIYRALKNMISSGQLNEAGRLPTERALGQRFGVTRPTVRKAMNRLLDEGVIFRQVGRGTFVVPEAIERPSPASDKSDYSLPETLEARLLYEPRMAELAVERASDDELQSLSVYIESLRNAQSWPDFKEAKYQLHLAIARFSRNRVLIDMFERILQSRRNKGWARRGGHLPVSLLRDTALQDNIAIVEALQRRDAAATRQLIEENLTRLLIANGEG